MGLPTLYGKVADHEHAAGRIGRERAQRPVVEPARVGLARPRRAATRRSGPGASRPAPRRSRARGAGRRARPGVSVRAPRAGADLDDEVARGRRHQVHDAVHHRPVAQEVLAERAGAAARGRGNRRARRGGPRVPPRAHRGAWCRRRSSSEGGGGPRARALRRLAGARVVDDVVGHAGLHGQRHLARGAGARGLARSSRRAPSGAASWVVGSVVTTTTLSILLWPPDSTSSGGVPDARGRGSPWRS